MNVMPQIPCVGTKERRGYVLWHAQPGVWLDSLPPGSHAGGYAWHVTAHPHICLSCTQGGTRGHTYCTHPHTHTHRDLPCCITSRYLSFLHRDGHAWPHTWAAHLTYTYELHTWATHIHISLFLAHRELRLLCHSTYIHEMRPSQRNYTHEKTNKKLQKWHRGLLTLFRTSGFSRALSRAISRSNTLSISFSLCLSLSVSLSHTYTHALSLSPFPYIGSGTVVEIRQYGIVGLCAHEPTPALPTWFVAFHSFKGIHFLWKIVYHHTRHFKVFICVRVCVCVSVCVCMCVCLWYKFMYIYIRSLGDVVSLDVPKNIYIYVPSDDISWPDVPKTSLCIYTLRH